MKLKLASAMPSSVLESLQDIIKPLYGKPGMRILGIVELAHVERLEVAPDEDKEPVVTAGIKMRSMLIHSPHAVGHTYRVWLDEAQRLRFQEEADGG